MFIFCGRLDEVLLASADRYPSATEIPQLLRSTVRSPGTQRIHLWERNKSANVAGQNTFTIPVVCSQRPPHHHPKIVG